MGVMAVVSSWLRPVRMVTVVAAVFLALMVLTAGHVPSREGWADLDISADASNALEVASQVCTDRRMLLNDSVRDACRRIGDIDASVGDSGFVCPAGTSKNADGECCGPTGECSAPLWVQSMPSRRTSGSDRGAVPTPPARKGVPPPGAPPPGAQPSGALPPWATPPASWAFGVQSLPAHDQNKREVAAANKGRQLDIVMYGDSITYGLNVAKQALWTPVFGKYRTAVMGVPANIVEDLVWRLVAGGERPAVDPKVLVLLIGTNNLNFKKLPVEDKMEWLLQWLQRTMPDTKVVLMGLLPSTLYDTRPTNAKYEALAARYGAVYAPCGLKMNPADRSLFSDGLHPTAIGYANALACLKTYVAKLLP